MTYTQFFPASWSDRLDRFRVCAMTSTTFDECRHNEVICEGVNHGKARDWLIANGGAWTYLIGDYTHTPLGNHPPTLFLCFVSADLQTKFIKEIMNACESGVRGLALPAPRENIDG